MSDRVLQFILTGRDAGATNALSAVGVKGESVAGKVGSAFGKLGNQIGGEFGNILSQAGQGLSDFGEKGKNAGAKMAIAGVGIAGLGAALVSMSSTDKRATDQLKAAIEASGNSFSDYSDQIQETIKHQQNFGHAGEDTTNALAKLTEATQSPDKALKEMGVVADLAAAKHTSLADAAGLVAKILGGTAGRTLAQYGVVMTKNADGTKNTDKAVSDLAAKLHGQASASVNNWVGRVDIARTKLADWAQDMGQKFGPAITAAGVATTALGTVTQILQTRAAAAATAQTALAAANTAEGTSAATATVATSGLGSAALGATGMIGGMAVAAYGMKTAAHAMGVDVSLGTDKTLAATKGASGFNKVVAEAAGTAGGMFVTAMKASTAAARQQGVTVAATTAYNTVFGGAMANSGLKAKNLGAAITGTKPAYDKFIANLVTSQQKAGESNAQIRSNVSVLGSLRNSYLNVARLPDKTVYVTVSGKVDWASMTPGYTGTNRQHATGGLIRGPGGPVGDQIPILASDQEYMIQASSVAKYGTKFMDMVNAGKLAAGGPVTDIHQQSRSTIGQLPAFLDRQIASRMRAAAASVAAPGNISALQAYALSLFPQHGWGSGQLRPLIDMWNNESGWRVDAYNPNGGATGIPQALPGSKMASAGSDWRTNGATQIRWGEDYIASVYGTPGNAWSQWQARSPHWYGRGLRPTVFTRPTMIGVGDRGPETVSVTPGRGPAGMHVTVNVAGSVVTEKDLVRAVTDGLDSMRRRRGRGSVLDA